MGAGAKGGYGGHERGWGVGRGAEVRDRIEGGQRKQETGEGERRRSGDKREWEPRQRGDGRKERGTDARNQIGTAETVTDRES